MQTLYSFFSSTSTGSLLSSFFSGTARLHLGLPCIKCHSGMSTPLLHFGPLSPGLCYGLSVILAVPCPSFPLAPPWCSIPLALSQPAKPLSPPWSSRPAVPPWFTPWLLHPPPSPWIFIPSSPPFIVCPSTPPWTVLLFREHSIFAARLRFLQPALHVARPQTLLCVRAHWRSSQKRWSWITNDLCEHRCI